MKTLLHKRFPALLAALAFTSNLQAQQPVADVEMADTLRADGMIYVVVAVVAVVLAGFLAYLLATDRKLSRLERELRGK